ncbi:MAG: GIY-YIG nuclease family protein [Hyphomonadaceae bacterium]|nr:GIY-YIG nuclease family protein [Hyphomonadaceae bacterium]
MITDYTARMDRDFILGEVRRTAIANGGAPLGRLRLETESGIKEHHWRKFWARYSELVREAGLEPNTTTEAFSEDELCRFIANMARTLNRFPAHADIRVMKTNDPDFPNHRVFDRRLGSKPEKIAKVAVFCRANAGYEDVLAMCEATTIEALKKSVAPVKSDAARDGHVYMLRAGRFYKIGFSVHAGARERQIALQLPEAASTVHIIVTDDPPGIEAYWHRRFAEKRKNGEWFQLTRGDVAAFRRRKFM